MTYDSYEDIKSRLDTRIASMQAKARWYLATHKRRRDQGDTIKIDNLEWLDSFAKGRGVNVCCGDLLIAGEDEAIGVDLGPNMVATEFVCDGDRLHHFDSESCDFVVTNYLEGLPSPLAAFQEWWRVLKRGGVLAIICINAEKYTAKNPKGPMSNIRRLNSFTKTTLSHYMNRAQFVDIEIEEVGDRLRAVGYKRD